MTKLFKWRLKDNSTKCYCNSCSAQNRAGLVLREAWEEKDAGREVQCEHCGQVDAVAPDELALL